jgi:hypothetical protein
LGHISKPINNQSVSSERLSLLTVLKLLIGFWVLYKGLPPPSPKKSTLPWKSHKLALKAGTFPWARIISQRLEDRLEA